MKDRKGRAPQDPAAESPAMAARRRWFIIAMAGVAGALSIALALLRGLS
ncbi:hypothetical protein [Xanthobacter pseudotagetidis]